MWQTLYHAISKVLNFVLKMKVTLDLFSASWIGRAVSLIRFYIFPLSAVVVIICVGFGLDVDGYFQASRVIAPGTELNEKAIDAFVALNKCAVEVTEGLSKLKTEGLSDAQLNERALDGYEWLSEMSSEVVDLLKQKPLANLANNDLTTALEDIKILVKAQVEEESSVGSSVATQALRDFVNEYHLPAYEAKKEFPFGTSLLAAATLTFFVYLVSSIVSR